jgi:outer membrane protein TolC
MIGFMYEKDSIAIMAGINIPIQLLKRSAKINEAKALLDEARSNFLSTRNKILYELKDAFEYVMEMQKIAILYSDNIVPLAEQTFTLAQKGYENDKVDLLSVIDAQVELEDVELAAYEAIIDLYKAIASLKKAVGRDFTM